MSRQAAGKPAETFDFENLPERTSGDDRESPFSPARFHAGAARCDRIRFSCLAQNYGNSIVDRSRRGEPRLRAKQRVAEHRLERATLEAEMKEFAGRTAVVTGGGSGMDANLCASWSRRLQHRDVRCRRGGHGGDGTAVRGGGVPQGLRITTHLADVSDEAQITRFSRRGRGAARHRPDPLVVQQRRHWRRRQHVCPQREEWERTFNICWGGVYYATRAFLPMLQKARKGHIVNTSSINGFWASVGPRVPHTAYSAAKFAVKGFTEALIPICGSTRRTSNRSVVMPGHIGTSSRSTPARSRAALRVTRWTQSRSPQARARIASMGRDVSTLSDDDVRKLVAERERRFVEDAPTSRGAGGDDHSRRVKTNRSAHLVGADAQRIDDWSGESPERAYDVENDRRRLRRACRCVFDKAPLALGHQFRTSSSDSVETSRPIEAMRARAWAICFASIASP